MNELQSLRELREIAPGAELDARVLGSMWKTERLAAKAREERAARRVEDLALAMLVGALLAYVTPIAMLMLLRLIGAVG